MSIGYLIRHFEPGQCSKSSRTTVRSGFCALSVFKLPSTITPTGIGSKPHNDKPRDLAAMLFT